MNNLFKKIAVMTVGLTMAIGVGVAVSRNSDVKAAEAANSTYTKVTSLAANKEVLIVTHSTGGQYYLMDAATAATSAGPKYITCSLSNSNITGDYDSHLFTVSASSTNWKFATGTKYLKWSGTSSNTAVRINTGDSNNTWTYDNGTLKFSSATRYLGVYTAGTDWRSYNSSSATNYSGTGENIEFYEKTSSKTLSSIAVKTAPSKTTYYEGQYFDPTALVITATYSDSSTEDISYASYSSDFTFTPSTSTALTTSNTSVTVGYGGETTTQAITVNPDVLNSVAISGSMSTTSYTTAGSWSPSGLTVTGSYSGQGNVDVTSSATFKYYSNSAMTSEVATPEDLGVGENQTIYVKATVSGVSNTTGYSQTVTVTEAPAEVVINKDNIDGFSSTYAERTWTYGTGTNAISGKTYSYKNGDNIQLQKTSKSTCYFYNSDAIPGPITKVELTVVNSSATTAMLGYFGTSAITSKPASGEVSVTATDSKWTWTLDEEDENTYFYICNGADDTKYVGSVTITYKKVTLVDPTGITLDDSSTINMDTYGYGRRRLSATVEPFNANDKTVTWGTSDSSVVTVADGILTATGVGTATVYATTVNYVSDVETPNLKASVIVNVSEALYKKARFVPTSTSVATQADDYLPDGSVALSAESAGQWNNEKSAIQLASGKDVTFTISGYAGMKISGIDLIMSSNGSAGGGSLTVTVGSTQIFEIASAAFSDPTWNGAYEANACDLYRATTEYVVKTSETIKFTFTANANSLYVHSVAIRYLDYSLEQWCETFLTEITCSGTGSITDASQWDDLGVEFLDLDSDLKDIAAHATANKDSSNVIERAMARYDMIVRKYSPTYDDFIERFGEGKVNGPLLNPGDLLLGNINKSTTTIVAVTVISVISLAAIGGYFLLRKKKEI